MSDTVEVSLTRKIGGKNIIAVISFDSEDFDAQDDKGDLMLEAYQKVVEALDEAEVDEAIKEIREMPFPEIPDLPAQ